MEHIKSFGWGIVAILIAPIILVRWFIIYVGWKGIIVGVFIVAGSLYLFESEIDRIHSKPVSEKLFEEHIRCHAALLFVNKTRTGVKEQIQFHIKNAIWRAELLGHPLTEAKVRALAGTRRDSWVLAMDEETLLEFLQVTNEKCHR